MKMELIKPKPDVVLTLTHAEYVLIRQALTTAMEHYLEDDEKFAPFHDLNYDLSEVYDMLIRQ